MHTIHFHTSLRGIAAFSVFMAHGQFYQLLGESNFWASLYSHLFFWHDLAVDIFFILSGYILHHVYVAHGKKALSWKGYFIARIARIYPLYIAATLAMIGLFYIKSRGQAVMPEELEISYLLTNLLGIQEWTWNGLLHSINPPNWSISVELFLYTFIFPPLVFLSNKYRVENSIQVGLVILFISLTVLLYFFWGNLHFGVKPIVRGICGFCAGFVLCNIVQTSSSWKRLKEKQYEVVFYFLLAAFMLSAWNVVNPLRSTLLYWGILLIGFTGYLAKSDKHFLHWPTLTFLGDISYSLYLWHMPVLKVMTEIFKIRNPETLLLDSSLSNSKKLLYFVTTVVAVFLVSTISYYFFEKPARKKIREVFSK